MNVFKLFSEKQKKRPGEIGGGRKGGVFCHISILLYVSKGWVGRRLSEAPYLEGCHFQETC